MSALRTYFEHAPLLTFNETRDSPIRLYLFALANKPALYPPGLQVMPLAMLPQVLPPAEAASGADGLLELIGALILEE